MPQITPIISTLLLAANLAQSQYPVLTSSFTWNQNCGPTVACGPSAAGGYGTGYAAANNVTYAAGKPIIGGVGAGCGQCWHLQPISDVYTSNGLKLGTSVVVKINDQCTDAGYCDQEEGSNTANVNTKYGKEVHFDLCNATGVTNQFFGQIGAGVAIGYAQQLPDCSALDKGPFGSKLGALKGGQEHVVFVGPQSTTMAVVASSSSAAPLSSSTGSDAVGGTVAASLSSSTAVQSSTLVAVASVSALANGSSASPGPSPSALASGSASGHDVDEQDEQDDCDEL